MDLGQAIKPVTLALVLLGTGWTFSAIAQDVIVLTPDTGIEATISGDGETLQGPITSVGPPTAFVRTVLRSFAGGKYDFAFGETSGAITDTSDPVAAERAVIEFRSVMNGEQSLLVIANGYDRALAYRARITRSGNTVSTDVCIVLPGIFGFEHWPYPIERIELTELRLEAWNEGAVPRCE